MSKQTTILICAIASIFAACETHQSAYSLHLNVDNAEGQTLTFQQRNTAGMVTLDSAIVSNGEATFELPALPLDFYQIKTSEGRQLTVVIDSTENATITVNAEEFDAPTAIEGSTHTAKFHDWYALMKTKENSLNDLKIQISENQEDKTLITRFNELNESYYTETKKFIEENSGSPALVMALTKLSYAQEPELFKSATESLRGKMDNSVFYQQMSTQVARFEQQRAQQEQQRLMQEQMEKATPIGGQAPDFTQKTPEGKDLSLSDLRGKVVLIDFWASWCKPCRAENPNVVRMYNKYKNKGFDILSVSLDKTQPAWERAIQQDNMTWHHVSDLQAWNNAVARQYGVQSIPRTFLVDKDGKILAKNLRGKALENKLEELFGA